MSKSYNGNGGGQPALTIMFHTYLKNFCFSKRSKYFLEYRIRFIPQCNRYHIPQQVD